MHKLTKIYQDDTSYLVPVGKSDILTPSWVVRCTCGWREKAASERLALERINDHIKMPHKR